MKKLNINNVENKILDEQDKELDKLHKSVKKILYVSRDIYNEVEQQNIIVDRFDNKIDNTIIKVNKTEYKTQKMIEDDKNCYCIIS